MEAFANQGHHRNAHPRRLAGGRPAGQRKGVEADVDVVVVSEVVCILLAVVEQIQAIRRDTVLGELIRQVLAESQ